MKKKVCLLFCLLMLFSFSAFASNYQVSFSVASGDSSSDAYLLGIKKEYNPWLQRGNFTIVPSLGLTGFTWQPKHGGDVWGATFAGGLSFNLNSSKSTTYLFISSGPTYISDKTIGDRYLGSQFHFASTAALGVKFGSKQRHALEAFVTHYSHAGTNGGENAGFNIYGASYKYSF